LGFSAMVLPINGTTPVPSPSSRAVTPSDRQSWRPGNPAPLLSCGSITVPIHTTPLPAHRVHKGYASPSSEPRTPNPVNRVPTGYPAPQKVEHMINMQARLIQPTQGHASPSRGPRTLDAQQFSGDVSRQAVSPLRMEASQVRMETLSPVRPRATFPVGCGSAGAVSPICSATFPVGCGSVRTSSPSRVHSPMPSLIPNASLLITPPHVDPSRQVPSPIRARLPSPPLPDACRVLTSPIRMRATFPVSPMHTSRTPSGGSFRVETGMENEIAMRLQNEINMRLAAKVAAQRAENRYIMEEEKPQDAVFANMTPQTPQVTSKAMQQRRMIAEEPL